MTETFSTTILPQLASGAAHTQALGFQFDGLHGGEPRIHVPWREDLVGDPDTGVLASGLVTTMLDHVGGLAVWAVMDEFQPIATLDLRIDYVRAAQPGRTIVARGECYQLRRSMAFVRAIAHDGDLNDPVAHAAGVFILIGESEGGRS